MKEEQDRNQTLFLDIYHNLPITKSRSFADADTFTFKLAGQKLQVDDYYIDAEGNFVVELKEFEQVKHVTLGHLFGDVISQLNSVKA